MASPGLALQPTARGPSARASGYAAFTVAALSVASLAVGIKLMSLVGAPGSPVAAGGDARLALAPGWLTAAEILKAASATASLLLVLGLHRWLGGRSGWLKAAALFGVVGSALLAISAAIGVAALLAGGAISAQTAAGAAHTAGLASLLASALWAAGVALSPEGAARLATWARFCAAALLVAALGTLVAPPFSMLALAASLAWLLHLGARLLKASA